MKIENKEVTIRIGNKTKTFTNMILNSYLDLFADSFKEFKVKDLPYCLINFTKDNRNINEDSTEMQYDLVLQTELYQTKEIITSNTIINKYYYHAEQVGEEWDNFINQSIQQIGFANYDAELSKYTIYAYIDVSEYDIKVQENQPIYINRVDKITSDMDFWSNNSKVKTPIHLTRNGILELRGFDYLRIQPKLYSVGFGVLPYSMQKEFLVDNLEIQRPGTGQVVINNILNCGYDKNTLYFNPELKMSKDLIMRTPTLPLLIYKFKLYKETYPNPEEPPVWEDTGMWYTQYKKLKKHGDLKLSIKYERS